jgi:hypothetical protein
MRSVGRIRYTLTASRFKTDRSTVERSSTRAMRGLSRKWVWLCAVERTPERSRSAFCRMRAADRAIRPPAASLPCISSKRSVNGSGGMVRSARTWVSVRSSAGAFAATCRINPVKTPRASSFQKACSLSRAPGSTSMSAIRRASSTASGVAASIKSSGL